MSIGASRIWDKQQQAMATLPNTINTTKAITGHDGCNQLHHCEAPKCSQNKLLKSDEEGCGDQP
jgi:hypothetical protein